MAERNASSCAFAAGSAHAMRVVTSGPKLRAFPSCATSPLNVLQPVEPLTAPCSSKASVGTASPAIASPSIATSSHVEPGRSMVATRVVTAHPATTNAATKIATRLMGTEHTVPADGHATAAAIRPIGSEKEARVELTPSGPSRAADRHAQEHE